MVNTDFNSCNSSCNGLHFCDCIDKEFDRFYNYIEEERLRDQEKSYVKFLCSLPCKKKQSYHNTFVRELGSENTDVEMEFFPQKVFRSVEVLLPDLL